MVDLFQRCFKLSEEDRSIIEGIRSKGLHQAREVNRAHVLSCLDRDIPEAQIMAVLGIGRTEAGCLLPPARSPPAAPGIRSI